MNKKYFIAGFAFLAAIILIYNVSASCIMPGSVEEEFARADAVFEGAVINVEEFDEMNNIVTFEVNIAAWKGNEFLPPVSLDFIGNNRDNGPITIFVVVPDGNKVSVGYNYEIGKRYIVYAYDFDEDGQLETNSCTRTNLNVEDYWKEKAELDILYSLNFGGAVKGDIKIVDDIPAENDDYNLASIEVKGDYLEAIVSYSGGCEEHEFTIYVEEDIMKSLPPQQNIYLIHDNNGDSCEGLLTKRIIFDLTPLKKQFEVCPLCANCGEPCTYSQNELVLNVYDSNGEKTELVYILQENEDKDDKVCTLEVKECSDGSYVSRNPELDCEFDPCPTNEPDAEPIAKQSTIQKFVSWIKNIFS